MTARWLSALVLVGWTVGAVVTMQAAQAAQQNQQGAQQNPADRPAEPARLRLSTTAPRLS